MTSKNSNTTKAYLIRGGIFCNCVSWSSFRHNRFRIIHSVDCVRSKQR